MATCARVCQELPVEVPEVPIDYNFCEFMADFLYQKNPIPRLELRSKSLAELNTEFDLQNQKFIEDEAGFEQASTLYVESHE